MNITHQRLPSQWLGWFRPKESVGRLTNPLGPANRRHGLPLGGVIAWITYSHGKTGEEFQAATQTSQRRMVGHQQTLKIAENMGPGNGFAVFHKQSFQVFLAFLLAIIPDLIIKLLPSLEEFCRTAIIDLR